MKHLLKHKVQSFMIRKTRKTNILFQWEHRACFDEHNADILARTEKRHTRSSFSTAFSLSLLLVFVATLEKFCLK